MIEHFAWSIFFNLCGQKWIKLGNMNSILFNMHHLGNRLYISPAIMNIRTLVSPEAPVDSDYLSLSRYLSFFQLDICQKSQFRVKKGWKALFLQLKPQEMHWKQEDSATLKIYFLDSFQILQSCKVRHACMLWSEHVPEENWIVKCIALLQD